MGRTVINETENKQTIILNDSPEGVEGGYFDEEMVWHEFGGESQFVHVTINVDGNIAFTLDNVLWDSDGLADEYPSAFDPDAGFFVGSDTILQERPYQVEALAMKYIPFYSIDSSSIVSYEGTVKHVLLDGDMIFYADEDGQTLTITLQGE